MRIQQALVYLYVFLALPCLIRFEPILIRFLVTPNLCNQGIGRFGYKLLHVN